MLEWVFGKRMTPAERLRKNQRMLDKAIRELDQTRVKLEKQEKTLIQQIKTSAKNGQMGACKIQAKDLVRTRRYVEKFYSMRSQLQKISLRLQVRNTSAFAHPLLRARGTNRIFRRRTAQTSR